MKFHPRAHYSFGSVMRPALPLLLHWWTRSVNFDGQAGSSRGVLVYISTTITTGFPEFSGPMSCFTSSRDSFLLSSAPTTHLSVSSTLETVDPAGDHDTHHERGAEFAMNEDFEPGNGEPDSEAGHTCTGPEPMTMNIVTVVEDALAPKPTQITQGAVINGTGTENEPKTAIDFADEVGDNNAVTDTQAAPKLKPPTSLAELILDAVEASTRVSQPFCVTMRLTVLTGPLKSFVRGDVAVITDPEKLGTTLLIPSDKLFEASDALRANALLPHSELADGAIRYMFILQCDGHPTGMPKLTPLEHDLNQKQLKESSFRPHATHERSIKSEMADASGKPCQATDWVKVYDFLLRTIVSSQSNLRFGRDATSALPNLEPVLQVAQSLEVIPTMRPIFQAHILEWIGNKTLYQAIADQPPSWLLIGCTFKQSLIYQEAFTHISGSFPDWPWCQHKDAIPPGI